MKKWYGVGCVISGILHAPLIKEEEYVAYGISTLLWPLPLFVWGMYIHYLTWGTYQHERMSKAPK